MSPAEPTRARDRPDGPRARPGSTSRPLLGTWVVFEPGTTGIDPGRDRGAGRRGPRPRLRLRRRRRDRLGRVAGAACSADDVAGAEAWAFRAGYDHGWQRVELFGYLNRGVLAVEAATTFTRRQRAAPTTSPASSSYRP